MTPTVPSWPAIAAAWGILLAGAAGVMKTVDTVRGWAERQLPNLKLPGYTWIVVAFGTGIVTCVTSHLNPLVTLYPPLAHTYGEVLSGIALGAIASPMHHGTALLSAKSKAVADASKPNYGVIDATTQPADPRANNPDAPPPTRGRRVKSK